MYTVIFIQTNENDKDVSSRVKTFDKFGKDYLKYKKKCTYLLVLKELDNSTAKKRKKI